MVGQNSKTDGKNQIISDISYPAPITIHRLLSIKQKKRDVELDLDSLGEEPLGDHHVQVLLNQYCTK